MTEYTAKAMESIKQVLDLIIEKTGGQSRTSQVELFCLWMARRGKNTHSTYCEIDVPHGGVAHEHIEEVLEKLRTETLAARNIQFLRTYNGHWLMVNQEEVIGLFYRVMVSGTRFSLTFRSNKTLAQEVKTYLDTTFPLMPSINRALPDKRTSSRVDFHTQQLPIKHTLQRPEVFYPYLAQTPQETWERFKASSSNILLLIGGPGTGKSTFIRDMLNYREWDDNVYLIDRDDVLMSSGLPDFVRDRSNGSLIISEDSDKLVMKREDGNAAMAALLNTTSGIASSDTKIIISTNLSSLRKVDEALLRPGRTFKVLKFQKLTQEQAYALRDALGLPVMNLTEEELTLAETLNYGTVETDDVVQKTAFGFNNR